MDLTLAFAWELLAWTVIVGWVALGVIALTTLWMIVDWYVHNRITRSPPAQRPENEERCACTRD